MTNDGTLPPQPDSAEGQSLEGEETACQQLEFSQLELAKARERLAQLTEDLAAVRSEISQVGEQIATTEGAFPFVVEQSIARDAPCHDIKMSKYPNLQYIQVVQTDGGGKIISVWKQEEAFQSHGDALAADLGIALNSREPEFSGHQRTVIVSKPRGLSWLKSTGSKYFGYLVGFVGVVAAIFSQFDTIRDLVSQYFTDAKVTVVASTAKFPVRVGQRFSTDFELQNTSPFASSFIQIVKAEIRDDQDKRDDKAIVLDEFRAKTFPLVKPAEAKILTVSGRAIRPGNYKLRIEGYFTHLYGSNQKEISLERKIEVWKAVDVLHSDNDGDKVADYTPIRGNRGCEVNFQIRAGQEFPNGWTFSADLLREPGIEFDGVSLAGVLNNLERPPSNNRAGQEAISIPWRSKRLESFDIVEGTIKLKTVDGTIRTADQWKQISAKVEFTATE